MKACGHVFKYGDNVDTDVIIPARYLNATKGEELAVHCMEDIDKDFVNKVQKGDIIVANKNFGCGSSREHAPLAIKCAGVSCVIAETFARIFYRNSINIGLPIIECAEAARSIEAGDEVEVDFDSGMITNKTKGESYQGQSFPPFMQRRRAGELYQRSVIGKWTGKGGACRRFCRQAPLICADRAKQPVVSSPFPDRPTAGLALAHGIVTAGHVP